MIADFNWTSETVDILREHWASGLSAGRIAASMGISKNAVVGKAHRLNLPPRPSPIIRAGEARAVPPGPPSPRQRAQALQIVSPIKREAPVSAPGTIVSATTMSKTSKCCWPIGETRSPDFRYCEAPCLVSKSYCQPHHALLIMPAGRDGAAFDRRFANAFLGRRSA